MLLLPLHPSAQPELRGGSRPASPSVAVGPGSLSKSVFRHLRCSRCWSFDLELQRELPPSVDCRSFGRSPFPPPVLRVLYRSSRRISPSYKDRCPPKASDSSGPLVSLHLNQRR